MGHLSLFKMHVSMQEKLCGGCQGGEEKEGTCCCLLLGECLMLLLRAETRKKNMNTPHPISFSSCPLFNASYVTPFVSLVCSVQSVAHLTSSSSSCSPTKPLAATPNDRCLVQEATHGFCSTHPILRSTHPTHPTPHTHRVMAHFFLRGATSGARRAALAGKNGCGRKEGMKPAAAFYVPSPTHPPTPPTLQAPRSCWAAAASPTPPPPPPASARRRPR